MNPLLIIKRSLCSQTSKLGNVLKRKQNGIFLIGINRPEKRNCINHKVAVQLLDAFNEFHSDKSAKVAVLYGEGNFSTSLHV